MSTIVEKLLNTDPSAITKKTDVVTLKLKRLKGESFEFPIQSLDAEVVTRAQDKTFIMQANTGEMEMNTYDVKVEVLKKGCPTVFDNKAVREHFNCIRNDDVVNRLLTSDELTELYDAIMALSEGAEVFSDSKNLDEEVKN